MENREEMTKLIYFADTGRIVGHASGSGLVNALLPGLALLASDEILSGDTHYVQNDQPTPRPTQATTLNGLTLENLPVPAQVTIDGVEYTTDAAEVELDFPLPGTYQIRVSAFPYLDWTGEVTA